MIAGRTHATHSRPTDNRCQRGSSRPTRIGATIDNACASTVWHCCWAGQGRCFKRLRPEAAFEAGCQVGRWISDQFQEISCAVVPGTIFWKPLAIVAHFDIFWTPLGSNLALGHHFCHWGCVGPWATLWAGLRLGPHLSFFFVCAHTCFFCACFDAGSVPDPCDFGLGPGLGPFISAAGDVLGLGPPTGRG